MCLTRFYNEVTIGKELVIDIILLGLLSVVSLFKLPLGIAGISFYYLFYIGGYYITKYNLAFKVGQKARTILFSCGEWPGLQCCLFGIDQGIVN